MRSHPSRDRRRHRRAAFTLFEIVISLLLLTVGVISTLMLFPVGIKAQQLARFQLYAAAKAEEMIETFTATQNANPAIDTEAPEAWNVHVGYRPQDWDLECRLSSHRYGIMPLPLAIARRLDSDGDEIQRILEDGGNIYYAQPGASTTTEEQHRDEAPANETQKLLFAVRGYAQQNALTIFPQKNWPYVTPWPSPPIHGLRMHEPRWLPPIELTGGDFWTMYVWPNDSWRWEGDSEDLCYPWETARIAAPVAIGDPDAQKVFDWPEGDLRYGYFPYACGRLYHTTDGTTDPPATNFGRPPDPRRFDDTGPLLYPDGGLTVGRWPSRASCIRYVQAAAWYCRQKIGDDSYFALGAVDPVPGIDLSPGAPEPWKQVQALRFLSHAATCLTAWYAYDDPAQPEDLRRGVAIPPVTLDGVAGPDELVVTHELIVWWHERALVTAMEFAARFPYDWAVPRPAQRSIMTDHPLLQYDLFSPTLQGTIVGASPTVRAEQWRPIAPRQMRNIGLSYTYPGVPLDARMISVARGGAFPATSDLIDPPTDPPRPSDHANRVGDGALFGDVDHYSLTAPFAAWQRCREIVFWSADWQSYEDFETVPSAPVDASKYPLSAPREEAWARPSYVHDLDNRMIDMQFRDEQLWAYRNPEKTLLFWPKDGIDPRTMPTGSEMADRMILNEMPANVFDIRDSGPALERRMTFNGLYGADRNFNKRLDRGPLPTSARLRAQPVARFNFYDPRLVCLVR